MSVGAVLDPERQTSSGLARGPKTRIGAIEVRDETPIGATAHATASTRPGCACSRTETSEGSTDKTVGGITTSYLYDGLALVSETVGGGGGTSYFVHGAGIDEPLAMSKAGAVSYFAVDSLGSITATTDASGTVTHAVAFDAWGLEKASYGTRSHGFTYTAREVGEAGSLFYRARYYSPGVGRFTQEDPLGEDSGQQHRYVYVGSDPTIYTDASGLTAIPSNVCGVAIRFLSGTPNDVDNDLVAALTTILCHLSTTPNVACCELRSITISATSNGTHTKTSLHYAKPLPKAVDISEINGKKLAQGFRRDDCVTQLTTQLQNYGRPEVDEDFGPSFLESEGHKLIGKKYKSLRAAHTNHVHFGVDK